MHASLMTSHGEVGPTRSPGFSLIEMMVVIVLVAILAAVAYPSYTSHVRKTRRTDATLLLSMTAQRLERCHAECSSYAASGCASNCPELPLTSPDGHYRIDSGDSPISAHAFTLVARPVAGKSQAQDTQCAAFSLTHLKQRGAVSSAGVDTTAACWN